VSKTWIDAVDNSVASSTYSTYDGREDEDDFVPETGEIEGNESEVLEVDASLATTLRCTAASEADSPAKHAKQGTAGKLKAGHFDLKYDTKFTLATQLLEDNSKTKRKMSQGTPGRYVFATPDDVNICRTTKKEPKDLPVDIHALCKELLQFVTMIVRQRILFTDNSVAENVLEDLNHAASKIIVKVLRIRGANIDCGRGKPNLVFGDGNYVYSGFVDLFAAFMFTDTVDVGGIAIEMKVTLNRTAYLVQLMDQVFGIIARQCEGCDFTAKSISESNIRCISGIVTNCFAGVSVQWVGEHPSELYSNGVDSMPQQIFLVEMSDNVTGGFGLLALMLMKLDTMRADILRHIGATTAYTVPANVDFFDDGGDSDGPTAGGGAGGSADCFNTTLRHHPKAALGDATNVTMEETFIDERSEDCIQLPIPTPINYKLCNPNTVACDPDLFARFCANL
jgi:hypothetical protein